MRRTFFGVVAALSAFSSAAEEVAVPLSDSSICRYSASSSHGSYPVSNAFNGKRTDRWLTLSNQANRYAQVEITGGWRYCPTRLILTGLKETSWSVRDPKHVILRASNDGENWDVLLDESGLSAWTESEVREWEVSSTKSYGMFRLEIPEAQGVDQYRGLSEIELMCDPAKTVLGARRPVSGEQNISTKPTFDWGASAIEGAVYRVYLGKNETLGEEDLIAETSDLFATLPDGMTLDMATTYYWRVDTVTPGQETIFGEVISFSTFVRSEAPIVVEDFETYELGALNGKGAAGAGWTSGWSSASTSSEVVAQKLTYRKGKIVIDGGNQAVRVSANNQPLLTRYFDRHADSPVYYSFMINAHIPAKTQRMFGAYLGGNTDAVNKGVIGTDLFWSNGKPTATFYAYNTNPVRLATSEALSPDETHFIVVKIVSGDYDQWGRCAYSHCYVYVDPSTREEPEAYSAYVTTALSGAYYVDRFYLRLYSFAASDYAYMDEFRLGSTWESVIPPIPSGFLMFLR